MTKEEKREARKRVKKELNDHRDLIQTHDQIQEQIKKLELRMCAPGTSRMGDEPRGGRSSDVDPLTEAVHQMDQLLQKYREKLAPCLTAQNYIEQRIEPLDDVEQRLMRYRYIDGLEWEDVCRAMAYSWSHTHRVHARALDKLAGVSGENGQS